MITPDKPLEKDLLPLFTTKAPFQLPEEWKDLIVKISPWIMLILVPLILLGIGVGAIASIFSTFTLNPRWSVSVLISIAAMICSLLSIKGLFDRKREGWVWSYYAFGLNILADLIGFNIIGGIISFLIGGFFLFQIRERYTA
ncbi:MAG: hypothetical protein ACK4NY_13530 [Spirosomataceae bacterium]